MRHLLIGAAVFAALATVFACSSHDHEDAGTGGHTSPYASCQRIITACHEYDVGSGPVHDCHEVGHDGKSEADCTPKEASCLATCAAAAADSGTESGTESGASEGGSDAGHDH